MEMRYRIDVFVLFTVYRPSGRGARSRQSFAFEKILRIKWRQAIAFEDVLW
jgi:hypothetical protein